jgi:hypothetical protein
MIGCEQPKRPTTGDVALEKVWRIPNSLARENLERYGYRSAAKAGPARAASWECSMGSLYDRLLQDPLNFFNACYDEGFRLTPQQIETIHLEGSRRRFAELRPNVPVLDKLAGEQGISEIARLNDVAPLLFPHTVYKSYPMSYLEKSRFDKLTKWLSGLTTTDLSRVDASGIDSIDDWLDLLEAQTPLLVSHTSGTTGKLSFSALPFGRTTNHPDNRRQPTRG